MLLRDILECTEVKCTRVSVIDMLLSIGQSRVFMTIQWCQMILSKRLSSYLSGSAVNILLITPEKAIKLTANDLFRHWLHPSNTLVTPFTKTLYM